MKTLKKFANFLEKIVFSKLFFFITTFGLIECFLIDYPWYIRGCVFWTVVRIVFEIASQLDAIKFRLDLLQYRRTYELYPNNYKRREKDNEV